MSSSPIFNDRSTPLSMLATRRSGKPRDLVAPGPSAAELDQAMAIASRTPDHGKLAPWRFVVVEDEQRPAFAALLAEAYRAEKPGVPEAEVEAAAQFAYQAPALVVVLSSPVEHKVPRWEQELSAGAACMNLLHGVHAQGYAGGWLTGWAASSARVRDAFGQAPERIVGFVFIGTPSRELEERPRPDPTRTVSRWDGAANR